MASQTSGQNPPQAPKAEHGARSEVTWEGGSGRQPYTNQGTEEGVEPNAPTDKGGANRGEVSGRNQEQLDEVMKK